MLPVMLKSQLQTMEVFNFVSVIFIFLQTLFDDVQQLVALVLMLLLCKLLVICLREYFLSDCLIVA